VLQTPPLAPLALGRDMLLATIEPGEIVALLPETGAELWRRTLAAPPQHPPVVAGDAVYVTLADSRLVALSRLDGTPRWEQAVPGRLSAPIAATDRVYVGSDDNRLYAFDAERGMPRWSMAGGGDVLGGATGDGFVYYVSLDNIVRALNQGNGNQRWREATGTRPLFPPIAVGGLVIVPGVSPAATVFNGRTGAQVGTMTVSQGNLIGPPLVDRSPAPFRTTVVTLTREGILEALTSTPLQFPEPALTPATALPGRPLPREALQYQQR
jgi:outer membrane protein assembly factor BamB